MSSTESKIFQTKDFRTDTLKLYEDILNSGSCLRTKVTGRSMSPFLVGGEIVTIKKSSYASLWIGDLIFIKSRDTSPLLHRIVRKQRTDHGLLFQTKGDGVLSADNMISEIHIMGKVCRVEQVRRNGEAREIDMESHPQRFISYMTAMFSLAKTRLYCVAARILPLFLRKALKKVFI